MHKVNGDIIDHVHVWHAGALEGIFSVGMLFLGWRTLAGARQAIHKVAAAKR